MARIRTVKPEIAFHEELFELEHETGLPIRFAWCMLFCHCDREGRFVWRPKRLGAQVLPYDGIDFSRVLHAWLTRGFIRCYRVGDEWYGEIPTFRRHQVINNRESNSEIPPIDEADQVINDACGTRELHEDDAYIGEGNGREGNREREHTTRAGAREGDDGKPPAKVNGSTSKRFDEFWSCYPSGHRKAKKRSKEVWQRKGLDQRADEIIADVMRRPEQDDQWRRGYIPNPSTYLNQERWEDDYQQPQQAGSEYDGDPGRRSGEAAEAYLRKQGLM